MSTSEFYHTLRAEVVDVAELNRLGADLNIGKVRITDRYTQAVAGGAGLELVDRILKGHVDAEITHPPGEPSKRRRLQDRRHPENDDRRHIGAAARILKSQR